MPLTMATMGQQSVVKRVIGKDEIRRYLESLGFVEGETVTVVTELNGNLIVNVKDTRLALSRNMANRILI